MNIIAFVKEHPFEVGVGVIGAFFLLRIFGGGGGGNNSQAAAQSAYFAAQSAEAQSGNALQAVQIESQAQTAQTLISTQGSVLTNQLWANAQMHSDDNAVTIAGIDANAQVQIAPYAVQNNLISALGAAAQTPGQVVTSSHSDNFLGLFGSSGSSQTYIANPTAVAAGNTLQSLAGSLFGSSSLSTANHAAH